MNSQLATLAEALNADVKEGELWEPLDARRIRCYACGHCCPIFEGQAGVCKVRFNRGQKLFVPWGYVHALNCDPIEKKPFFHVKPGALAYSFGMLGCDLHCGYCQNWVSSQALRDPAAAAPWRHITAAQVARQAASHHARAVVSTYNEPLITSEWAVAIFKEAKALGLMTGYVSNGNATPRVLEYVRPWTDLYKVDLKGFDDRHYRDLGGRIQPILDSIRLIHSMGFWLEVVTLIVPGFNDSDDEFRRIAEFLAGISADIPWHVTAFHSDYKMLDTPSTSAETLMRAFEIGREAGLRFVYAGNLPGQIDGGENTRCPTCRTTLVERRGFRVLRNRMTREGKCPECSSDIPGLW